jgi:signal transduction histidine kinase
VRFSEKAHRFWQLSFWKLVSLPVYLKILGTTTVLILFFGAVTLVQTRSSVSLVLHELLDQRALSTAHSLAASLERSIVTGDLYTVRERILRTKSTLSDIRYVVVRDPAGHVVAHSFEKSVPEDLLNVLVDSPPAEGTTQVLGVEGGLIFAAACPILRGDAGTLYVGITDRAITRELSAVTRSTLWVLGFCVALGAGFVFLLSHVLIRPIQQLTRSAEQIRLEKFETRAEVLSGDEIGRLTLAFNQMADSLQRYRREVIQKEKARVALVEKTLQAQETERKNISRELHDHLGQSLLALLLLLQSNCRYSSLPGSVCREMEERVKQLIDEVHRLASGMRPSILDDYGLDSALQLYVKEVRELNELEIDYQHSSPPGVSRLPPRVELTLYRVAQEAVTNILRHASASHVSIVLLRRRDEVTLLIEDDGCGFDLASVQQEGDARLGVTGMKERVSLLGGVCTLESYQERGTTVKVSIPLEGPHHVDPSVDRR